MKISFAVTTHDENELVRRLLTQLQEFIEEYETDDEIVIVDDYSTEETDRILEEFTSFEFISVHPHALERNFSAQKNYLNSLCTGDYIFQIDAD